VKCNLHRRLFKRQVKPLVPEALVLMARKSFLRSRVVENDSTSLSIDSLSKHEFIVKYSSFKSSSIQQDLHLVNDGPFRVKETIKQGMLQGGSTLWLAGCYPGVVRSRSWQLQPFSLHDSQHSCCLTCLIELSVLQLAPPTCIFSGTKTKMFAAKMQNSRLQNGSPQTKYSFLCVSDFSTVCTLMDWLFHYRQTRSLPTNKISGEAQVNKRTVHLCQYWRSRKFKDQCEYNFGAEWGSTCYNPLVIIVIKHFNLKW